MENQNKTFNLDDVIHHLKHYLPAQAPLKDFIHHNTLHAFQDKTFHAALNEASQIFGYKVYLTLEEYRTLYREEKISRIILEDRVVKQVGENHKEKWINRMLNETFAEDKSPRVGLLRSHWKSHFKIDLDSLVHPLLFRIICSYLDQGISIWNFPAGTEGFLDSIRELERNSLTSFFKTKRAKELLLDASVSCEQLLKILIGDEELFEHYIFDQQFAHPGWSGIVSVIEDNPHTLIDRKEISLLDLIKFELILEIDALDSYFGAVWSPLGLKICERPTALFAAVPKTDYSTLLQLWQDSFEWTFYDAVLSGLSLSKKEEIDPAKKSFQAIFCIDDRECSIRRYVEQLEPSSETFGTAGHFNVEFYYQPEHSKFFTKVCPAPLTPKFLIKEKKNTNRRKKEVHFTSQSHGLFFGWIYTYTVGFWSAFSLFFTIFRPKSSAASVSSFRHMDKHSILTIQNTDPSDVEAGLQVGFSLTEMADRVEGLLRSIGMVDHFAPLVYAIGHGSSSVNNTHYAGYDCGACSGRPGSVNARVVSHMANHPEVREILASRGIFIPEKTQFVGGLHDTSRDEMVFYDLSILNEVNYTQHLLNQETFEKALDLNSKERSRRFMSIHTKNSSASIHREVKQRTVSLFEPRPELNHATNAMCIVGRRAFSKGLFLDRRSFLNSFDYRSDPTGKYLLNILNAVAPVCGGINLEYYFSRVDNQQLGAGTKLPHNVMGLFAVANGIDGDLRTGLPSQMIEVHDPLRLLVVVEHDPEVVLETIKKNPATYQWFENDWVKLVAANPDTNTFFVFEGGEFKPYSMKMMQSEEFSGVLNPKKVQATIESTHDNLPVYLIEN